MIPKTIVTAGRAIFVDSLSAPASDTTCPRVDVRLFTPDFLLRAQPAEVRCWLFCAEYDALDIARVLRAVAFEGLLRTRSVALPRANIIRREILRECPGLRIVLDTSRPSSTTHCGAHHAYEAGVLFPDLGLECAHFARSA